MDYSAVNAKVKAMRGRLLNPQDYQRLATAGTQENFFAQLKQQPNDSLAAELQGLRLFLGDQQAKRILNLCTGHDAKQGEAGGSPLQAWAFIKTLPRGQNREALSLTKGSEIDLQNILTIYRYKRYYPGLDAYQQLTPIHYRLSRESIKQMAESPGLPEFIVALRHSAYKHLPFEQPEAEITESLSKIHAKAAKRYPRSMAGVMAYLFAKRQEVARLNSMAEAIGYGLPAEEVLRVPIM